VGGGYEMNTGMELVTSSVANGHICFFRVVNGFFMYMGLTHM